MVARGRGKKAAATSEAAVALANGDAETQGNDEVAANAVAPAPVKKGRPRAAKKEAKEEPEESPPVEIADKPTKAGKSTKGQRKVSKGKAAVEPEEVPIDDEKEEALADEETAEEKLKTAAVAEKKTNQRKRKADSADKVEEPASVAKKASKTKTKGAKKETVDSAGVPENPDAKITPVLPEEQTNGNKKSASNRKRAAPKVEEAPPSADEEEQAEEEQVATIPPAAKKPSRGRAPKKDAKKPATKAKAAKKVAKAPEDEAPEDDVLPEDEFNPEEDKEEEQNVIPEPEPEPEIKTKKTVKSKGSRKQLKDDIPPVEEEVAEIKEDVPESQDSEGEEVKKPKGRKPSAKKTATAAAKGTSKKTTKAKKIAKADSAEESVNDDQDADIGRKTNGSVEPKVAPAEKKRVRGGKRGATTPSEIDETDGSKSAKLDGLINATDTDFKAEDFSLDKEFKLKIASWNIAGLRSWLKKDKLNYLQHEQPDVLCLQETKCTTDQLPEEARIPGYHPYWLCMPGGHAGVAIYSKIMPINVEYGIGNAECDDEGRMITAEYEKYYLICVYVPNSGRKLVNLEKRLKWESLFREYVQRLDTIKPVIIAGDMNVSHKEIDLANPKTNTKNAGFTPEERDALTKLLELGYVDTFRHLYPDKKGAYTFWSYMGKARSKNVGWRLDYFIVSERITSKVVENTIRAQVLGSDHCPITLFLNI